MTELVSNQDNSIYNYKMYFNSINLLFIDTPKCACTSIKKVLARNEFNLKKDEQFGVGHKQWGENHPELRIRNDEVTEDMNVVAVIRNPYDRIISSYRNIFLGRMKKNKSFRDFVLLLPEFMKKEESNIQINHFRPCNHFYEGVEDLIELYKLEEMDKLIDYLSEINVRKDLIDSFPRANASKNLKNHAFYFDNDMLDVIHNIYNKDFHLGNYSMSSEPFTVYAS